MEDDSLDMVEIKKEMVEDQPSPRSEFAAVIFHNIPETYPADANIDCQYTLTSDLYPNTRDYIGLYKVGWMSYRDYLYYEWAPWPEGYEAGKDTDSKVIFPASALPKDDGEFYQFCYVMRTGQIRGASMPFQFKRPCADDFVEEEDTEADMLVIRSKTIVLEERLKKAEDERQELLKTHENLGKERDSMITKLVQVNKQLEKEKESASYLMDQLKLSHDKIKQLNKEEEDMILVHDQLEAKLEEVTQLKTTVEGRVLALETEIEGFQRLIKSLQNEKDELMGKNRALEQEKELYKSHLSSSESTALSHQQQVEELRQKLESAHEQLHATQADFVAVKVALETEKCAVQKSTADTTKVKERTDRLEEMLRNAEDKLDTEENTKKMLMEEILAFQVTQEKMSRSLENSELESDKLRDRIQAYKEERGNLVQSVEKLRNDYSALEREHSETQAELTRLVTVEKEVAVLEGRLSRAQSVEQELKVLQEQTKESSDSASACHFALQKVNDTLKERLAKSKKHNEELLSHKDELLKKQKQHEQREHDLVREVTDLTERIFMCSAEYKTLFQKNRKLQKKIDKMEKFSIRSKSKSESGESTEKSTSPETEVSVENQPLYKDSCVTLELQEKLELVAQELEKKQAKKGKYKKMYQDEKDRQELLRKHYYEETCRSEEEIEKLKRKNADMQAEFELKYRSMQNLLSQREKEIEELTRSRRHMVELQQDKDHKPESPRKGADPTSPSYSRVYPALMFPNPYDKAGASERVAVCYPPQLGPGYTFPQPAAVYEYPPQTSQGSSASSPAASCARGSSIDKPDSVHVEIDRLSESEASGPLDPLIAPTGALDPPLQPTVLPLAKVAAVRSAFNSTTDPKFVNEDFVLTVETSTDGETVEKIPIDANVIPSAPVAPEAQDMEEERYLDAAGEAMKMCPSCNQTFPYDVDEHDFNLHVVEHFGRICPLCDALLDKDASIGDFERHVNGHFQD